MPARIWVLADAHLQSEEDWAECFAMLGEWEQRGEPLVFLGDIFDLFVGHDRYLTAAQRQFLDWCQRVQSLLPLGFVEGNHEFFVRQRFSSCFTWSCAHHGWWQGIFWAHGDLVNRQDRPYRRFRRWSKSAFAYGVTRWLPGGPTLTHRLKERLRDTNQAYKQVFPRESFVPFLTEHARRPGLAVFGHFHRHVQWRAQDWQILVAPAWQQNRELMVVTRPQASQGEVDGSSPSWEVSTGPWRTLLAQTPKGNGGLPKT